MVEKWWIYGCTYAEFKALHMHLNQHSGDSVLLCIYLAAFAMLSDTNALIYGLLVSKSTYLLERVSR